MTDAATEAQKAEAETQKTEGKTYTQADIDRIVQDRVARERAKFADYDELKAKVGETRTLEERVAELDKRAAESDAKALRSDIAAKHGLSAEDRELFLTGTDEATLTAQAERLVAREAERKKQGNLARDEGVTKTTGDGDREVRDLAASLFRPND